MQWVYYSPLPTRKDGSLINSDYIPNSNESEISDNNEMMRGLSYYGYNYNRYFELSPLLPFGMMLVISTVIFILIIFRRWPGLVAGIIAGCLTSVSIYLMLLAIRDQKLIYE